MSKRDSVSGRIVPALGHWGFEYECGCLFTVADRWVERCERHQRITEDYLRQPASLGERDLSLLGEPT